MSKVLSLYNTFTRKLTPVKLSGKLISSNETLKHEPLTASMYICGPTVYSDCHLGHALTYIRADLLRRALKSIFNIRLETVMNITDIDDKIIEKAKKECGSQGAPGCEPSSHPFNAVSERYYKAFLRDMATLRVLPADLYVRVSRSIDLITSFISQLEKNGSTYMAENGDILFQVSSIKNYVGRTDSRKEESLDKKDPRDFVLWKQAKPFEPRWFYRSAIDHDKVIPGRPGWHVQCSAISSAIFGNELDFHYGGKDLIFPHHYNEEACCCAYHSLDTSQSLHVWSQHWLHSGHLIMKDTKMSKSLGNVVPINKFVDRASVNALRLLCISSHYRSDLMYSDELIEDMRAVDHKINALVSYLREEILKAQDNLDKIIIDESYGTNLRAATSQTRQDIVDGICEDLDLAKGLDAILNLSKQIYSTESIHLKTRDLLSCWSLLNDWCNTFGLEYTQLDHGNHVEEALLHVLTDFRHRVRDWTLFELKAKEGNTEFLKRLLNECDNVRAQIGDLGFVFRDKKSTK